MLTSIRIYACQFKLKQPLVGMDQRPLLTVADRSNPWWTLLQEAVAEAGGELGKPEILFGSTDARYIRAKGIPAFGFSPIANTPILLHDHNEVLLLSRGMIWYVHYESAFIQLKQVAFLVLIPFHMVVAVSQQGTILERYPGVCSNYEIVLVIWRCSVILNKVHCYICNKRLLVCLLNLHQLIQKSTYIWHVAHTESWFMINCCYLKKMIIVRAIVLCENSVLWHYQDFIIRFDCLDHDAHYQC